MSFLTGFLNAFNLSDESVNETPLRPLKVRLVDDQVAITRDLWHAMASVDDRVEEARGIAERAAESASRED